MILPLAAIFFYLPFPAGSLWLRKTASRVVQVSIKSEELRAVLLRPGQVVEEELQATMCGLECCLRSGEGNGSGQDMKKTLG